MTQVTLPELMAALPHILAAPKDDAPIHSLCLRPGYGLRSFPTRITMTRAFGIPGEAIDGMDVLAVKAAGETAVAHCRSGKGPYILEIKTYRYRGHSMSDPAKYRTREEVQKIREEKDAIEHVRDLLLTGKHCSEEDLKAIDKDIKAVVNESAEFAKQSPEPALDELWTDIYAQAEA